MSYKKNVKSEDGFPSKEIENGHYKKIEAGDQIRRKSSRRRNLPWWEKISTKHICYAFVVVSTLTFVILLSMGFILSTDGVAKQKIKAALEPEYDELEETIKQAREVANAFIDETSVTKRLTYVRHPELVKKHLPSYPSQARNQTPQKMTFIRHIEENDETPTVTRYAIAFEDGSFRLLSIIHTDDGPKVDWDCYARYCSASWDDLFSGVNKAAEVRVFVRLGNNYVAPFLDRKKWISYELETPDDSRVIYAYSSVESGLTKRMQESIMKSEDSRQSMTLNIKSAGDGGQDNLFIIDDLLAIGWVKK